MLLLPKGTKVIPEGESIDAAITIEQLYKEQYPKEPLTVRQELILVKRTLDKLVAYVEEEEERKQKKSAKRRKTESL